VHGRCCGNWPPNTCESNRVSFPADAMIFHCDSRVSKVGGTSPVSASILMSVRVPAGTALVSYHDRADRFNCVQVCVAYRACTSVPTSGCSIMHRQMRK